MKLQNMSKAYTALTDALKYKADSWMVIENLLFVCMSLGRLKEAILHMGRLIDLRHKSNRPLHLHDLRRLSAFVAIQSKEFVLSDRKSKSLNLEDEIVDAELPPLAMDLIRLFQKIAITLDSNADVWDICAEFHGTLNRRRQVLDCRYKEVRARTVHPSWPKEKDSFEQVVQSAEKLVVAHLDKVMFLFHQFVICTTQIFMQAADKNELYACVSLLKSMEAQARSVDAGLEDCQGKLSSLVEKVASMQTPSS